MTAWLTHPGVIAGTFIAVYAIARIALARTTHARRNLTQEKNP
jgi:hypothetical protein